MVGDEVNAAGDGLAPTSSADARAAADDWARLLAAIAQGDPISSIDRLLVAVAYLDLGAPCAEVEQHLGGALEGQADEARLPRWLLRQCTLYGPGQPEGKRGPVGSPLAEDLRRLAAAPALERRVPRAAGAAAGDDAAEASRLVRQLMLVTTDRWEELAAELAQGDPTEQCLAAHVYGDRLGQREEQVALLGQLSPRFPLFVAESLLDLAWAEASPGLAVGAALQAREAALGTTACAVERVATTAVLALCVADSGVVLPPLPVTQRSRAWAEIEALAARRGCAAQGPALAEQHLQRARVHESAFAAALRLRAAQLLVAADEPARADAALALADDVVLGPVLRRMRLLCQARLGQRAGLARALMAVLVDLAPAAAAAALHLAVELAIDDPPALRAIAEQLRVLTREAPPELAWEAGGLLLAASRRLRAPGLLREAWLTLGQRLTTDHERALCAFAALGTSVHGISAPQVATADRAANEAVDQQLLTLAQRTLPASLPLLALTALRWPSGARWEALLSALLPVLEGAEPAAAVAALCELARQLARRSDGRQQALGLLERAGALAPGAAPTLRQLAEVQLSLGQPAAAAATLEQTAALVDDLEAAELFCEIGRLHRAADPTAAAAPQAFYRALELNPFQPEALNALRLLLGPEAHDQRIPLLEGLLSLAPPTAERVALLLDLVGDLRRRGAQRGGVVDLKPALDRSAEALSLAPADERVGQQFAELCQLTGERARLFASAPLLQQTRTGRQALAEALVADQRWAEAVEAWRAVAAGEAGQAEAKEAALLLAGRIALERLGERAQAVTLLQQAWRARPGTVAVFELLHPLLADGGRWAELAALLEEHSALIVAEKAVPLRIELARLALEQLGNRTLARQQLEQVLAAQPTQIEALRLLASRVDLTEGPRERARVLEQIVAVSEGQDNLLEPLLQLGALYAELGDEGAELRILGSLQQLYPDDEAALRYCEQAYARHGRWAELASLYERRLAALAASNGGVLPEAAAALLERKGHIELDRLGARSSATDSFIQLLELRPGDTATVRLLEQVLTEGLDWARMVTVYERQASIARERAAQIAFLRQAARVARERLRDEAEALRLFERLYKLDPTDAEAFAVLEGRLERQEDHRRLVDLLVEHAAGMGEPLHRLEALLRAAGICERIPDVERALTIYRQAHLEEPASAAALDALARIYESRERWQELLETTEKQIAIEPSDRRRALLCFKCGSVMETQFANDHDALRYYTRAVKMSATCLPALHGLRDLHARRNEWDHVARTLELEARIWKDPKGKADTLARLGELYKERLNDPEKAKACYHRAIEVSADCLPAALALFEIHADRGDAAEAARWGEVCNRSGTLRRTPALELRFYVRWARALARCERPTQAAEAALQSLELAPADTEALVVLLELCRHHPGAYDFQHALEQLSHSEPVQQHPVARALVDTCFGALAEQRGDVEGALALFRRAQQQAPDELEVTRSLADLLLAIDASDEALQLMQQLRARAGGSPDWLAATGWLASFELLRRGRPERAAALYREILQREPAADETRQKLVECLLLAGAAPAAYAEMLPLCEGQSGAPALTPLRLAEQLQLLGMAAYRSGRASEAERHWRRASEVLPQWVAANLALARRHFGAGDLRAAERELKAAEQNAETGHDEVQRAQAQFYAASGHPERAVVLLQKVCRGGDAAAARGEIDDRVALARLLAARGDHAQAATVLRAALADHGAYAEAYGELLRLSVAVGDTAAARRAAQVLESATGQRDDRALPPALDRPVSVAGWESFTAPWRESPCDFVLHVFDEVLPEAMVADRSQWQPVVHRPALEARDLAARVLGVSGVTLARVAEQAALVRVQGSTVLLSEVALQLERDELRVLLLRAAVAVRLGYPSLLASAAGRLRRLRELTLVLLGQDEAQGPGFQELLRRLPRRTVRQLTQLRARIGGPLPELFDRWLASTVDLWDRLPLLLGEDFGAWSRVALVADAFPPAVVREGGLLVASPAVERMAQYYVSAAFVEDHRRLWS
ncbi:MAG: hypothetical protein IPL40_11420 [Proteobacteria bacterium]|nr:hypothetical protein [Pseudomonadota bacterium]